MPTPGIVGHDLRLALMPVPASQSYQNTLSSRPSTPARTAHDLHYTVLQVVILALNILSITVAASCTHHVPIQARHYKIWINIKCRLSFRLCDQDMAPRSVRPHHVLFVVNILKELYRMMFPNFWTCKRLLTTTTTRTPMTSKNILVSKHRSIVYMYDR